MAAITSTALTLAGVLSTDADGSVAASDTIAEGQFGSTGVILRVTNGSGGPLTVTIDDPNTTIMGSAPTDPTVTVADGTTKTILIPRSAISGSSGLATVSYSATTSVTYELYRI